MTILQHAFGYANILRLFAKQMKNGEKDLLDFMKHGSEGYMNDNVTFLGDFSVENLIKHTVCSCCWSLIIELNWFLP